jgi:hypothetical protein
MSADTTTYSGVGGQPGGLARLATAAVAAPRLAQRARMLATAAAAARGAQAAIATRTVGPSVGPPFGHHVIPPVFAPAGSKKVTLSPGVKQANYKPTEANLVRWIAQAEVYSAAHGAAPAPTAPAPTAPAPTAPAPTAPASTAPRGLAAPPSRFAPPGVGAPKQTRAYRVINPAFFVKWRYSPEDIKILEEFFPPKNEKLESIELVSYPGQDTVHTYRGPDQQANYIFTLQQEIFRLKNMEEHEYPGSLADYEVRLKNLENEYLNQQKKVKEAAGKIKDQMTRTFFSTILPELLLLRELIFYTDPNERTLYILSTPLLPEEVHNYGRRIAELKRLLPNNVFNPRNIHINIKKITEVRDYIQSLLNNPNLSEVPKEIKEEIREEIKTEIIRDDELSKWVRSFASFGFRIPKRKKTGNTSVYIANAEHPLSLREDRDALKDALRKVIKNHKDKTKTDPTSERILHLLQDETFLKDLLASFYFASNSLPYSYVADRDLNSGLDHFHARSWPNLLTSDYMKNRTIYIARAQEVNLKGIHLDARGAEALYNAREDQANDFFRVMEDIYQQRISKRITIINNPSTSISTPEPAAKIIFQSIADEVRRKVNPGLLTQTSTHGGGNTLLNKNILSFALLKFLENPLPSEIDTFAKIDPSKMFTDSEDEYEIFGKKYKINEMPPIIFPPKSYKKQKIEVTYSKEDEIVYEKAATVLKELLFGDLDKKNDLDDTVSSAKLNNEITYLPGINWEKILSEISGPPPKLNNYNTSHKYLVGGNRKTRKTRKHRSKKHKRYSRKK